MISVITIKKEIPCSEFRDGFVDIPRFAAACAACPRAGGTWACPPFDFSPETIWDRFSTVLIYAKKILLSEEETRKVYAPDALYPAYEAMLRPVRLELLNELYSMEAQRPGSLALSAGGCDICESCTRPEGLPCRVPAKMRYSVEAVGGDVLKAIERILGESVLWAHDGLMPEHFILVGALLY